MLILLLQPLVLEQAEAAEAEAELEVRKLSPVLLEVTAELELMDNLV
jgi:hypothetical protein